MTEKDKHLLDNAAKDYFISISDKFYYYRKNLWKKTLFEVLFGFSFLLLILHIIPVFTIFLHVDELLLYTREVISDDSIPLNFWTRWLIGIIFFLPPVLLFFIPYSYWKLQFKQKAVKGGSLPFCYAYDNRKSLSNYLINEHTSDLKRIINYLEHVVTPLHLISIDGSNADLTQLEEYTGETTWFQVTDKTRWYAKSINHLFDVVEDRVDERSELDSILPIFDYLVLYEFSRVRPNEINLDGEEVKSFEITFLEGACLAANQIELTEIEDNSQQNTSVIERITKVISAYFNSNKILALFISWFVLFLLIFTPLCLGIISSTSIKLDSTIVIGILSVPFAGAIAMTTTIYSKRKS